MPVGAFSTFPESVAAVLTVTLVVAGVLVVGLQMWSDR